MPSIHHNDITMKTFLEGEDLHLKKYQLKMLKMYESIKDPKMTEEWELYIKKSELFNTRSSEFYEVEEFLVKSLLKLAIKMNEGQSMNSFSLCKTTKMMNGEESFGEVSAFPDNSKFLSDEKSQLDAKAKTFMNRLSL